MSKGRLEAFSDGVLAILITIMVLELRTPPGTELAALAVALGRDLKGKISLVIYASTIPLAFVNAGLSCALYVLVAVIWFVPDRRIEKALMR
jgi:uncharacterized membrane protein